MMMQASYAGNVRWEVACDGCVCESVFIVNVKGPQCRSHAQDTGAGHMKEICGIESRRQTRRTLQPKRRHYSIHVTIPVFKNILKMGNRSQLASWGNYSLQNTGIFLLVNIVSIQISWKYHTLVLLYKEFIICLNFLSEHLKKYSIHSMREWGNHFFVL